MKTTILIKSQSDKAIAKNAIDKLPLDKPVQIEIKPFAKKRTKEQNSYQWVGMLADFSEQGIIDGRQFSVKVWHKYLKEKFMPEKYEEGITLKNYVKWVEMPDGTLRCEASTTKLTTTGFSNYMMACFEYGERELDIQFTASPNQNP